MSSSSSIQSEPLKPELLEDGHPKIKHFLITRDMLVQLVSRNGWFKFQSTIPQDARLLWIFMSESYDGLILRMEHRSFSALKPNESIPTDVTGFLVTEWKGREYQYPW